MRYLRAVTAALLLLLLTAGFPLALATTVGNPLTGWESLRAGDVSDVVLLDVLAALAWAVWVYFAWAVLSEILTLASHLPHLSYLHLPGTLPGAQPLAHTLITAAVLTVPGTAALLGAAHPAPTSPTAVPGDPPAHSADIAPPGSRPPQRPSPASRPALSPVAYLSQRGQDAPDTVESHRTAPAHRATSEIAESSIIPGQFAEGAAVGLAVGVTARELARLRRRQWRHRRPGRIIAPTPPAVTALEIRLAGPASATLNATERAQILAAHVDTQDQPMPASDGHAPWDAFIDAAGALRPEFLTPATPPEPAPKDTPPNGASPPQPPSRAPEQPGTTSTGPSGTSRTAATPGVRILSHSTQDILRTSATTAQDVQTLSPPVPPPVHTLVRHTDPTLDHDLAEWHSSLITRPRLSVLGPVHVRAAGALPAYRPRQAWHSEVVAYLAAHPGGVTMEKFGNDLWPEELDITAKPKLRHAASGARHWLGKDPVTGRDYLPAAPNPAGASIYRIINILTDADLFRRLRLRALARGPSGIHDLETALRLVTGPPYDPTTRRAGRYRWLINTPLDADCTAMIVDVAHLVATHHLSTARPDLAERTALISLTAGSQDDVPLLDLMAASDAQGHRAEAARWIQQIMTVHDAEVEEDLPPRTAEILRRRRWHQAS
jgi:hypothetical protein